LFSKEASEEARLDEKGRKDKKRKDEAARRERTGKKEGKGRSGKTHSYKLQTPPSKDIMINIIFIYYTI